MLCMLPAGARLVAGLPELVGSRVTAGGMLNTTQCHQPLPVGASGSKTVTAKLLVPAGTSFQVSSGDTFWPLQPKPLNTCFRPTAPLAGTSVLESSNANAPE